MLDLLLDGGARCPSPGRTERLEHRAGSLRRPRPACWEGPPEVGSVGRSSPTPGGFGPRDRRLRVAGAGSGSGPPIRRRGLRAAESGRGSSRYSAPRPSGHGAGDPATVDQTAPRPPGHGRRRSRERGAGGPPPGGATGGSQRSAPRSWRGKPRRLLGATTVFRPRCPRTAIAEPPTWGAQLRRAQADWEPCSGLTPPGPRGATPCQRPLETGPGPAPSC